MVVNNAPTFFHLLLLACSCFSLVFSQQFPATLRSDLLCGTKNGTIASGLSFCQNFNGLPLDSYYFENITIGLSSIQSFDEWAQKIYGTFASSLSAIPTKCTNCLDWYRAYLCAASLPGKGYSACYEKKWWNAVRTIPECQGSGCVVNGTCTSDCCPCGVPDSSNCTLENVKISDDEDFACGPVPYTICTNTFSACLGLSTTATRVLELCQYWNPNAPGSKLQKENSVNPPAEKLPVASVCPAEFSVGLDTFDLTNTTSLPLLKAKGCTPRWITPMYQQTVCSTSWAGKYNCHTVSTPGRPYLTCGTSKTLLSTLLVLVVAILFFIA